MATTTQARPSEASPTIRIRRFGRSDFERFDQETATGSHLCVGGATIGKVDIDCKYHWKKAQWGVLGSEKTPAGIIYMDITFKQPKGYWLERANVFVTLSEDLSSYACTAPRRSSASARRPLSSEYAVQITEHYGPRFLTGTKTFLAEAKHDKFVPTVGIMGYEFGGIGRESTALKTRVGRWVFKGTVRRPKGRDGLRTLEWELTENDLDPEQVHSQAYQTAFAFEHRKRPVFMRVEVQGKLRSRSRQMTHELLRFSSTFSKKDDSTLTELDLGRHIEFTKSLDQVAQGLDLAMQMANYERVPLEVPDPTPAQFHLVDEASPEKLPGQTQRPPLRQRPASGQGDESLKHVQYPDEDPIVESLRRQLRDRLGSDIAACVSVEEARRDLETTNEAIVAANGEFNPTKTVDTHLEAVEKPVLEILKIPALLVCLRFIATVLQWFSASQQASPGPRGKVALGAVGHEPVGRYTRLLEESVSKGTGETQFRKVGFPSPRAVAVEGSHVS